MCFAEHSQLMVTPARAQALATLEAAQAELDLLFAQLTEAELIRPETIGGSGWAAKDLVSHLAFWEELAVDAIDAWRTGRLPRVANISGASGTDQANADNQAQTAHQSPAEIRSRATSSHRALLEALRSVSEVEWHAPAYESPSAPSVGDMLGGVLGAPNQPFGHAYAHLGDLRDYVGSLNKPNGQAG
jgi:hypothetical protein